MRPAEDALIRRAQALDPGALAELYDRHFDGIYRYLYTRVRHQADAEDLTEQVFLKMVDSIARYRPQGVAFSSWLYRIAHNLLVDRYRRAGRETVELSSDLHDLRPQIDPATMAQQSDDRRRLMAAIQRLTPEQQQIVSMRFVDGLEVEEIARLTHRSPGAIHSMQHRALASLYRFLMEEEEVEARHA
ncbi:MAG TPA: sigma-70 family RNA polymerase sigma factor [Candidatus Dormibacteraeota bacterium]